MPLSENRFVEKPKRVIWIEAIAKTQKITQKSKKGSSGLFKATGTKWLDLPESKRKLTVNFMVGCVFWINKNNPTQWLDFSLAAYYISGT